MERTRVAMSPSMNLVEEVKRTYSLNDRELAELETGMERMELERQMSHDTLELILEKVYRRSLMVSTPSSSHGFESRHPAGRV